MSQKPTGGYCCAIQSRLDRTRLRVPGIDVLGPLRVCVCVNCFPFEHLNEADVENTLHCTEYYNILVLFSYGSRCNHLFLLWLRRKEVSQCIYKCVSMY